jgi:hypothetical protein
MDQLLTHDVADQTKTVTPRAHGGPEVRRIAWGF